MKQSEKVKMFIKEINFNAQLLPLQFDNALIGTGRACGGKEVAAYDLSKCVEILIKKCKLSEIEALEQIQSNIDDATIGENKPIFINDFRTAKLPNPKFRSLEEKDIEMPFLDWIKQ